MNSSSYKVIFVLLSFCVFSVLALQAYWIRNAWLQKMEQFDTSVYAALETISGKIEERENLNFLRQQIILTEANDSVKALPAGTSLGSRKTPVTVYNLNKNVRVGKGEKITTLKVSDSIVVINKSSQAVVVSGDKTKKSSVLLSHNKKKPAKNTTVKIFSEINGNGDTLERHFLNGTKEIEKLVDKMIAEIQVIQTGKPLCDSALKQLIQQALNNRGIFTQFEFAVKKIENGKAVAINISEGFKEKETSYRRDLSSNKIFATHNFLFLQFPAKTNMVLAGLKGSLALSIVFSLIVLGVFYYTMRLISKQKRLSDIKNDFVNNMTHELKTPIATISLAVDAINNPAVKNDEEKFRDYSRILKEENGKLNNHVERVLQLSLLEKGKLQLHKTKVDINQLIQSVIDSFKLRLIEQKAMVTFVPLHEDASLFADEHHLSAVFSNLLDNALKYSTGECRIEITVLKTNDRFIVLFRDNGIGIETTHQEKIFEKFYRVQGGNLHDVKGFGLGLSYAKSIVESHGGTIELHSEKGEGTEFLIKLPA